MIRSAWSSQTSICRSGRPWLSTFAKPSKVAVPRAEPASESFHCQEKLRKNAMTPTLWKLLASRCRHRRNCSGGDRIRPAALSAGVVSSRAAKAHCPSLSAPRARVPHRVVRDEALPTVRRQAKCQMYFSEAQSGGADSHQSRGPGAWLNRLAEKTVAAARPKPPRCAAGPGIVAALTEEPGEPGSYTDLLL